MESSRKPGAFHFELTGLQLIFQFIYSEITEPCIGTAWLFDEIESERNEDGEEKTVKSGYKLYTLVH